MPKILTNMQLDIVRGVLMSDKPIAISVDLARNLIATCDHLKNAADEWQTAYNRLNNERLVPYEG